jgi:hypothetical protein
MTSEWAGEEKRMGDEDDRREQGSYRRNTDNGKVCMIHQETIKSIEEHLKDQDKDNLALGISLNTAKITNGLMIIIFIGSFIYTYNHIMFSARKFELQDQNHSKTAQLHRALIDSNKEIIQDTRGDYKALLVKLDNLTREIQKSNTLTGRLFDAILEDTD